MDTPTHALWGALVARATVAARGAAGFFASAFPDVDVVLSLVSPITYMTQYRGLTHSILLLPVKDTRYTKEKSQRARKVNAVEADIQ